MSEETRKQVGRTLDDGMFNVDYDNIIEEKPAIQDDLRKMRQAYATVFREGLGKKVFLDLLDFCGLLNTSVCEVAPNPHQTMYCEGKRRVGLRLINMTRLGEEQNERRTEHTG